MNHTFSVEHAVKYGLHESIMIGNLQFWLSKNRADKRNQYDGRTWTYNTSNAFSELLPYFSSDAIDRIIKSLVKKGVIVLGNYNERAYDRTRWIAFVDEKEFLGPLRTESKGDTQAQKASREIAEGSKKTKEKNPPAKSRNGSREITEPSREIAESLDTTDITPDVNADKNLQTGDAGAPQACASETVVVEAVAAAQRAPEGAAPASSTFEAAWAAYPARTGNSKLLALAAWQARVGEGVAEQTLLDGTKAYAAHCEAEKVPSRYVLSAGRFFSTEGHYAADWSPKAPCPQPTFFEDVEFDGFVAPI